MSELAQAFSLLFYFQSGALRDLVKQNPTYIRKDV
jgi:hypothetical protein